MSLERVRGGQFGSVNARLIGNKKDAPMKTNVKFSNSTPLATCTRQMSDQSELTQSIYLSKRLVTWSREMNSVVTPVVLHSKS